MPIVASGGAPSTAADGSLAYLPVTESAALACSAMFGASFNARTRALGLPNELPTAAHDYRPVVLGLLSRPGNWDVMAVRVGAADTGTEQWVDGLGEVLGAAFMDCGDEAWGIGPIAVSPSAQGRGVGRALMQRCLEEAKQKGVQSVRLVGTVSNIASFGLYHSLGFRACEYMVDVHGHILAEKYTLLDDERRADGISLRPMTRDDIAACSQLYIAANSFSRLAGITGSFEQQGAGGGPAVSCYVAVDENDKVVGYSTGATFMDHQSAHRRDRCTLTQQARVYQLASR